MRRIGFGLGGTPPMAPTGDSTPLRPAAPVRTPVARPPSRGPSGLAPLAERLAAGFRAGQDVPVRDAELAEAATALHAHELRAGVFGEVFDDMRIVADRASGLELQLMPNRTNVPKGRGPTAPCACVLCAKTDPDMQRLSWRSYWVRTNAFPYVPKDSRHMLVLPTEHLPQGFSPRLLADMIDYQRLAARPGRPVTMHYNGIVGNTQYHLHWQATDETLPIDVKLRSGALPTTALRQDADGRIEHFDGGPHVGLLVRGSKDYVTRWAQRLVERIESDPKTRVVDPELGVRGTYNLVLLPSLDGEVRLVVTPRRASVLSDAEGQPAVPKFSGFCLTGRVLVPKAEVPEGLVETLPEAMRAECVPPSELGWLDALRGPSNVPWLALRAGV
jgi:hypothetical protein